MNGVHDMGGMHGFGRVTVEKDEPVFHEAWEGRVYTMLRQLNAKFPPQQPGAGRDIIEHIDPAAYLSMGYYERFLEVLEKWSIAEGVLSEAEIDNRMQTIEKEGGDPIAPTFDAQGAALLVRQLKTNQLRPAEMGPAPRFRAGDHVVARNLNWSGHNRLPRYIRGKRGTIERVNGRHRTEDAHADALGPSPQTVYTVGFSGVEVWGPESEANLKVYLELWEGYLDPADSNAIGGPG